jgi:hypothetical protein
MLPNSKHGRSLFNTHVCVYALIVNATHSTLSDFPQSQVGSLGISRRSANSDIDVSTEGGENIRMKSDLIVLPVSDLLCFSGNNSAANMRVGISPFSFCLCPK